MQLVPVDIDVQLPRRHRGRRVVGLVRLPGTEAPDDDVTAAVLPGRDHALEVDVLDRVVLDMHGEPFHRGIQGRAVRHRPAHQHSVDLKAQVVMQAPGPVPLHDKPALAAVGT